MRGRIQAGTVPVPGPERARLPQVKLAQQLPNADAVMVGDALQNAGQGLGPDRIVQRDDLMMLAICLPAS